MNILWASSSNDATYLLVIIGVLLIVVFVALFVINMVNAKYRVTFYVDDKDVMKLYIKYHNEVVIPDELKDVQWFADKECTIPYEPAKKISKDTNVYSRTASYIAEKENSTNE